MAGWLKSKSDCYCAFCKSKRRIYPKKHASFGNFLMVLTFAVCVSTGLWTWWDPRAIAIFSVGMVGTEIFIYLRWRFSLVCTLCGFDPVLYRKSPELAREKVRSFYEAKTQDPKFLLSKSPLVDLYRQHTEIKRRNGVIMNVVNRKSGVEASAAAKELVPRSNGSVVDRQV